MSFNSRKDAIYGVFAGSDSDEDDMESDDYNSESSTDFPSNNNKRKKHKKSFKSKKGKKHLKNNNDDDDNREVMFVPQTSKIIETMNSSVEEEEEREAIEKEKQNLIQKESDEVLDAFEDAIHSATITKPTSTATTMSNNQFRDFLMQGDENHNHIDESINPTAIIRESANTLSAKEKSANLPAVSLNSLGTWEKHTKGIGSKLLQKFGFKGRLGANESGVSKAIEVVVRPNGLGLGFGDFKEATVSKTNREIEAEWRGVPKKPTEDEEEEEEEARRRGRHGKNQRSNTDTNGRSEIEKIAESKSWKKSAGKKQLQTATEILVQQAQELERAASKKQVIIDMRYQDVRVLTDLTKGKSTK